MSADTLHHNSSLLLVILPYLLFLLLLLPVSTRASKMDFIEAQNSKLDVQEIIQQRAVLHTDRVSYRPRLPAILKGIFRIEELESTESLSDPEVCQSLFPNIFGQPRVRLVMNKGSQSESTVRTLTGRKLRVGVVFSGGPAPGGHNILTGLFDFLKRRNEDSELVGFLGGPSGIVDKRYSDITNEQLDHYRNLGGFHFLGTGRTKIETAEQLQSSLKTCKDLALDGLVIVGGDDSNTNAAVLAEYFQAHQCATRVIGVPKTIDGDLRNEDIEASFGFDTATKVYSNQVANLCLDAISALKAYHFVRVMGRDASHITLEVALQTHPNLAFISEEVAHGQATTLTDIVNEITQLIVERAKLSKQYGVILIPEGLVSFVPDMKKLIEELNELLAARKEESAIDPSNFDASVLSSPSQQLYHSLPEFILRQMMAERDPHGNVQVAAIETERLLAHMVRQRLDQLAKQKLFTGKFTFVSHYFGYEGRCAYPSKFDCDYCYTLGATAAALIEQQKTGMIASVRNLDKFPHDWIVGGTPLTAMIHIERRKGKNKPVIKKKLVDLNDSPFLVFKKMRNSWMLTDDYRVPGPPQLSGNCEEVRNFTIMLEAETKRKSNTPK
eukprot:gene4581-4912_t